MCRTFPSVDRLWLRRLKDDLDRIAHPGTVVTLPADANLILPGTGSTNQVLDRRTQLALNVAYAPLVFNKRVQSHSGGVAVQCPTTPGRLPKRHNSECTVDHEESRRFLPPMKSQNSWKSGRKLPSKEAFPTASIGQGSTLAAGCYCPRIRSFCEANGINPFEHVTYVRRVSNCHLVNQNTVNSSLAK